MYQNTPLFSGPASLIQPAEFAPTQWRLEKVSSFTEDGVEYVRVRSTLIEQTSKGHRIEMIEENIPRQQALAACSGYDMDGQPILDMAVLTAMAAAFNININPGSATP